MTAPATSKHHPCFSCALPDCDEASRACGLKVALNTYRQRFNRGEPISDDLRQAKNIAYSELYGEVRRLRSIELYNRKKQAAADALWITGITGTNEPHR